MALSLTIPALVDKPLIIAETRPQKIKQFIDSLPHSDQFEAATLLLEEMEILNRQKVSASARIKALESYRPSLMDLTLALSKHYANATLPLSQKAKDCAGLSERLWLELSYGYKLALIDQQHKLFNLDGGKAIALAIQRAIDAMDQLAIVYYHTYVEIPKSLWQDINQLFFYAMQQSLENTNVADPEKNLESASLSFRRVMLMALSQPRHLAANEIDLVAEYIWQYAHLSMLLPLGPVENAAGYFIVNLDSSELPMPYVQNKAPIDISNHILLCTVELLKITHKHAKALDTNEPNKKQGLPESAADPHYLDILKDLLRYWGVPYKRVYSRSQKSGGVELGIGVAAAHYFINGETPYQSPSDNSLHTPELSTANYRTSRWQFINISAGGMGLRKFPNAEANIRVGDLVSLKNSADPGWSIGVLRWASNKDKQLDIGTQLIAPEAIPIGARAANQEVFEPVLLLPELPTLNQASSIISKCGMYSPARIMELEESGKISRVMATKLIERTNSFERFQFSYL